ncbi:hypothetical protein HBI56_049000 [Parastagonospora nodorum]|nr:hypothetical protein HBH54_105860 [Parastagonospora nodorum]KAH3977330.1 hypothetical protein HBH52_114960 [Parastagonospora nodorum]KAH4140460.1 hypothetical protein HBH45_075850 [Parastagonospora nodorum]KAH4167714.1 hypothetical protein HBH44_051710 [Parastagonospora nodorum]KAH4303283.1 hypothetical protein HBI01_085650 [Parastagonospora nodorum]
MFVTSSRNWSSKTIFWPTSRRDTATGTKGLVQDVQEPVRLGNVFGVDFDVDLSDILILYFKDEVRNFIAIHVACSAAKGQICSDSIVGSDNVDSFVAGKKLLRIWRIWAADRVSSGL